MAVDVGQILDKYELIERVGQGGMAVVYRGRDKNLRREVAVKVLHQHLAEHREARERFQREAHAVAKLHHENILEIYDFSGSESAASYIVTEFIEGMTLREFIAAHPLQYPEIGAMIALQICKALGHAHALGVLHRDVKPENVMIRSDGVVKLTDFGIAQMVDLKRMTVTGQLLGSPAYMAPEHVEGGDLDFRTDVFAVGIVLYQLVTSELPFQGKNPHEILKRIAECTYRDPRRLNSQVSRELADIITKALARRPEDRFSGISLMQQALELHLEGAGLSDCKGELARFFDAPAAYQMALRARLIGQLTGRAKECLATDQNHALEYFNRVLSLDENNRDVHEILHRIARRQRLLKATGVLGASAAMAALIVFASHFFDFDRPPAGESERDDPLAAAPRSDSGPHSQAPLARADATFEVADASPPIDSGVADARGQRRLAATRRTRADAAPEVADAALAPSRTVKLHLTPRGSQYRVDKGPWTTSNKTQILLNLAPGLHTVAARNESCCQSEEAQVPAAPGAANIALNLRFLPARLTPVCNAPGARVQIDGKRARLALPATIPIERLVGSEVVKVRFFTEDEVDSQSVTVFAKKQTEVKCRL